MIPPLSNALAARGYDSLTPVQEAMADPDLIGSDLLVSAQTGSGKTVAFGLAMAPTLLDEAEVFGPAAAPLALVVAPTRELAFQVMNELRWLYAETGARIASCVGGMDMRDERRTLERGAHIVVGTPGRLRDHISRGSLDMDDLRVVVLDEADEMLDLGFREDLEFMLEAAPENRRTLLFSATVPPAIARLAGQFQRDARRINTVSSTEQHADIAYQALRVAHGEGEAAIFNLLRFHDAEAAIVFANTRAAVNHLTTRLANRGFAVVSLSGELSQSERSHALQAMRDGRARICVATDVAARGIDLPNLNLVIHADLPKNTESLMHRSGRTGRAGRKGVSALIVAPRDLKKAERILKFAKITAEWTLPPSADAILEQDENRLLADPAWETPLTEAETAFAARLLVEQSPEAVVGAYLRLFRTRHAAPEELSAPEAGKAAPRRDHAEFGPATWISLSVGRKDRAEARWLLPLLLRSGNLDKANIGAIRVQDGETYVELSTSAVSGFFDALDNNTLEDGITVRQLDEMPDLGRPAPKPHRGARPAGGKPRHDGPPRGEKSWGDKPRGDKPRGEKSWGDKPRGDKPRSDKPRADKPRSKPRPLTETHAVEHKSPKPASKPAGKPAGKPSGKPAGKFGDKPAGKFGDKPGGKPGGKPSGKPGGKPSGKFGDKPGGKPGGKSFGKAEGKPAGKPGAKPAAKPARDGRDTSKRFTPPGGLKPGARQPRKPGPRPGGGEPPRRKG